MYICIKKFIKVDLNLSGAERNNNGERYDEKESDISLTV